LYFGIQPFFTRSRMASVDPCGRTPHPARSGLDPCPSVPATEPGHLIPAPPVAAPPAAGEAWVWAIRLVEPPASLEALGTTLTVEERARADRFRFAEDRARSIVGRGSLRVVLGACTGTPPAAVEIVEGEHGKPMLGGRAGETLDFNVSHSGDWVMIGIAAGARIGVDVEQIRPLSDMDALMERFFARGEARAIRDLPADLRIGAFFDCWTRKEAYIKAIGTGLQTPLARFEVEPRPGLAPSMMTIDGSAHEAARWQVWSRSPDAGHRAAVVVESPGPVRTWLWTAPDGPRPWDPDAGSGTPHAAA